MENLQWIFDGIGTAIIIFILGLIVGGGAGYKIGIKTKSINQAQKAGDSAIQTQVGDIKNVR